jgi:hypothetical protein
MFNPMSPSELILAIGRVLRAAADGHGPTDDYRRGQLLSAYSIARHLSAEEAGHDELLQWFRDELAATLEDRPGTRAQIVSARDGTEIGEVLVDLLGSLGESEADTALHRALLRLFADMADREVAALATAEK